MPKKTLFALALFGTLAALGLVYISFFSRPSPGVLSDTIVDVGNGAPRAAQSLPLKSPTGQDAAADIKERVVGGYAALPGNVQSLVSRFNSSLQAYIPSFQPSSGVGRAVAKKDTERPRAQFSPVISEEELFNLMWPEEYRASLREIERVMIQEGFRASTSPRIILSKDAEIYAFLEEIVNFALAKSWITQAQATNLRGGIRSVLPETIEKEKAVLRRGVSIDAPPDSSGGTTRIATEDAANFFSNLRDLLSFVKSAAASYSPGEVVCFKDDAPYDVRPGYNFWSLCCNCGLQCGNYCTYIQNCGQYSGACNVPLGCLNLICYSWENAIWDPLTGICGCG